MATLSRELRKTLERVVLAARREAESGARKALDQLAVAHHKPWATMTADQQELRRRLRARGGDRLDDGGQQSLDHLVSECAYEQWHRMLFARFLAECELLIEPASGVPVSVQECKELARARGVDWISLASTFAQGMLPQIFRPDDAVLEVILPAEHRQPLEQLLGSLSSEVFLADDSLGWVYQFWQSEEKQRVNGSQVKIGANELPAVTQLFTEDYMVDFLLDNTLGSWHAARVLAAVSGRADTAHTEEEVRKVVAIPGAGWRYLRFVKAEGGGWAPAAGAFATWPREARELRCLDPCMGSGHFIVAMFVRLVALRMAMEQLDKETAVAAVIQDNLFGLEIDPRCTQIAAFNLALAAWRCAGYCDLPVMNLACSGLAPNTHEADWLAVAGSDDTLQRGMARLHRMFSDAPVLGSLINPRAAGGDLLGAAFHELQPILEKALAQETKDDTVREVAVTALGLAKAAEILSGHFTLVATNVPYLGRGKQHDALKDHCERVYPESRADLATCFVERSLEFCAINGSAALVTPQNWLFLGTYEPLRKKLLAAHQWFLVSRLGAKAFQTPMWDFNVMLLGLSKSPPTSASTFMGLDASGPKCAEEKAVVLATAKTWVVSQPQQLTNPSVAVVFEQSAVKTLLSNCVSVHYGSKPGQTARVTCPFWEVPQVSPARWMHMESTPSGIGGYSGKAELSYSLDRIEVEGIREFGIRGADAWQKVGFVLSKMASLPMSIYCGQFFDDNTYVVLPKREEDLLPVYAFLGSEDYRAEVRRRNQKLAIDTEAMINVPFDLLHWKKVAAEEYPHGLPRPFSGDPTQWLSDGYPKGMDQPLHVAVARLVGYQWPRQTGSSFPGCPELAPDGLERFAASDGIVCISAVKGNAPASERLQGLLATAYGADWSGATLAKLLRQVGCDGKPLDQWLRDDFFGQHCQLFRQRPFIWSIWDGRRDGFSALVNYHSLTKTNLEKLTYAFLGEWISRQEAAARAGEAGSEARLVAALHLQDELKKILDGEPPYDIFVRWKPLAQQAIGWEPDVDDGVKNNIRPFLMATDLGKKGAGILRARPSIKWDKDRGNEPQRCKDDFPWFWEWDGKKTDFAGGSGFDGNRWNDLHYSREFKTAARRKKGLA